LKTQFKQVVEDHLSSGDGVMRTVTLILKNQSAHAQMPLKQTEAAEHNS
jgi:hypothetical protein